MGRKSKFAARFEYVLNLKHVFVWTEYHLFLLEACFWRHARFLGKCYL